MTSYSGVRMNADCLLAQRWDYFILDEGHKIRNPDAEITLICKQVGFELFWELHYSLRRVELETTSGLAKSGHC